MPFNGNGIFVLPDPPLEAGEIVSADEHNTTRDDMATGFTNCVTRDGQSPAVANLPMGTYKHTNVGASNSLTNYARTDQVQNDSFHWLTSVSGTNAITAATGVAPAAYAAGQRFAFVPANDNTGPATININSLGAKSIKLNGADDVYAGFLSAGTVYTLIYDGTAFQVATGRTSGIFHVERFSGDGSETEFTLSHSAISENYLLVYVYGVYQQKDTYTFSGNTLTFSTAPPIGTDNIEVVISSTLALGETDASQVEYTLPATGAVTQTVETKLSETVSVKDFGAVGDGVTDDTQAFIDALNASSYVKVPLGTYIISGGLEINNNCVLCGEGSASVLKRKDDSPDTQQIIGMGTDAIVENLYIDGNSANQTNGVYGILAYRQERCKVSNVTVYDNLGIGVGWSECAYCVCENVTVDGCKGGAPGFWNDAYTSSSFYMDGGHNYLYCNSVNNELDGISLATPNNRIVGGNWSNNGYGASYAPALGACGIFSVDGRITQGLLVTQATCNNNSEYGINVRVQDLILNNNVCNSNQLSGIYLKASCYRFTITGNVCKNNGWYTGSTNPNIWTRGGITLSSAVNFGTIANNVCYDERGASATQEYGIRYNNNDGFPSGTSQSVYLLGNSCRYNKIDNDNINPAVYTTNTKLLNVIYNDFVDGNTHLLNVTADNPNVGTQVRTIQLSGTFNLTKLSGGVNTQFITLQNISGAITIKNSAGGTGQFKLSGGTDLLLNTFGSNISFIYTGGAWYETSRVVF